MVDFENDIKNAVSILEQGGTILYPTDTVWGLGCDATNEVAVEKIYALKHRPKEKSLVVLLAEARMVLQYVAAPHPNIIEIVEDFERPTTVIYEGAIGFADNAVNENGTIAIRVTDDAFCKALIKRFRKPIISTSANISGEPTAATFNKISKEIVGNVDYVVEYRQDDESVRPPSRIVKIGEDGEIEVLRD